MTHVRRVAVHLISQLGITSQDLGQYGAQDLYLKRGRQIFRQVRKMKPETLGKISAAGRGTGDGHTGTTLYEVHCATYLDKYSGGMSLLQAIACTALVAEMTDVLQGR